MPLERRFSVGNRRSADTRPDELIARGAEDGWGIFTAAELRSYGLSEAGIRRRERAGRLHRRYPGVYAVGYVLDVPEARMMAAVKAGGPEALLSFRAAGWLWRFLEGDEPKPEITVPGPALRVIKGIRVHRSLPFHPYDRTRHRGVPITSAHRTLIDLAAGVNEQTLRHAVRRAQGHRRISLPSLLRTMERLGPRRGTAALRRVISTGPAPTKSELENVVLDLVLAAGFEHPDVNKPLVFPGRRVVPDFRWPKQRLILEAGVAWHDMELDAQRQALLEAHGERILRVTWAQAVGERRATIARIAAAGAPR